MGKQISYWMEYESFLLVAQKAIDLGCIIVKEDDKTGKVIESRDIAIVTPDKTGYYFHLPEAGEIKIEKGVDGSECVERGYSASENSLIEAGFSRIINEPERKVVTRSRIYCITGYYDDNGEYIPRPDCLTKVYNSLARFVKKVAPYTEITSTAFSQREEDYGQLFEYKHKEYVTKTCLDLKNNEGYRLLQI